MLAALALCGAATTAMVVSTAHAQPGPREPMMVAQADTAPARRGFNRPAPGDIAARLKDMCDNSVARETGRLAYLETWLDLTAGERPLFQRWRDAVLGVAHRRADRCNQQVGQRLAQRQAAPAQQGQTPQGQATRDQRAANRPGPADRMARQEDRLKERLADIEAERPALQVLYNALSPEQKTELARAGMRGRAGMMRARFAQAMGRRGPMGRLPMDRPGAPPLER
jgi:hypothetical protein